MERMALEQDQARPAHSERHRRLTLEKKNTEVSARINTPGLSPEFKISSHVQLASETDPKT